MKRLIPGPLLEGFEHVLDYSRTMIVGRGSWAARMGNQRARDRKVAAHTAHIEPR
jgi:hypothetical protein